MKYFKYLVLSAAVVMGFASCQQIDISERDKATRVSLSPLTAQFDSKANTYVAAVQVNSGSLLSDMSWEAKVTSSTSWVTLSRTTVDQKYTGTYDTETVYNTPAEGIEVKIAANTEYKRTFEITVTTADGTVVPFVFTQLGDKADAAVSTDVKLIEFLAVGGKQTIEYSTNMGDVVSFTFTNGDGSAATWLSAKAVAVGKVEVTADVYTNKEAARQATMVITVGTAATSLATVSIPVSQLAAEDHYFLYGASAGDVTIDKSIQMEKGEVEGIFTLKQFFCDEAGGNTILINKNSREVTYPYYALAADGKVAVVESASTKVTGPAIDANGLRMLTVNFNNLTWSWDRVTTDYAMPDSELKNYPTKEYIARDGSKKVWMVRHMAWDGGDIHPKLGSGMVKHEAAGGSGSGGYAAADFPVTWNAPTLNPAYETIESGLGNLETYSDDGRVYTYQEMLGYEARFGIGYARYEQGPWIIGEKITDARGTVYTIAEAPLKAQIDQYTGDNAKDEELYPMLKVQAQGICPYGWHVANASDWLDLFYAMAQASKSGSHTYPVDEAKCTYKQMINGGVPNINGWLRNTKDWGNQYVDEGADEFGFNYYPLGFRYMTQGFQCWSMRAQLWVPLPMAGSKPADYPSAGGGRINVVIKNNSTMTTALVNLDIGQAVCTFRCVKNYK